jgi:hypothetical protein
VIAGIDRIGQGRFAIKVVSGWSMPAIERLGSELHTLRTERPRPGARKKQNDIPWAQKYIRHGPDTPRVHAKEEGTLDQEP